jgi:hypothetical protein
MKCDDCPLNIAGRNFDQNMCEKLPAHARALFVCRHDGSGNRENDLFKIRQLCARDLWVLAFIGSSERFAVEQAAETLDSLVAGGHSELFCHLFENAGFAVRRQLWSRMVKYYPDRLYLFDSLFERECLPPAAANASASHQHVYRHYLLYGSGQANAFVKDF